MKKLKLLLFKKQNLFIEIFVPIFRIKEIFYKMNLISSSLLSLSFLSFLVVLFLLPLFNRVGEELSIIFFILFLFVVFLWNFLTNLIYKKKFLVEDPKHFIIFLISGLILVSVSLIKIIFSDNVYSSLVTFGSVESRLVSGIGIVSVILLVYVSFNSVKYTEDLNSFKKLFVLLAIIFAYLLLFFDFYYNIEIYFSYNYSFFILGCLFLISYSFKKYLKNNNFLYLLIPFFLILFPFHWFNLSKINVFYFFIFLNLISVFLLLSFYIVKKEFFNKNLERLKLVVLKTYQTKKINLTKILKFIRKYKANIFVFLFLFFFFLSIWFNAFKTSTSYTPIFERDFFIQAIENDLKKTNDSNIFFKIFFGGNIDNIFYIEDISFWYYVYSLYGLSGIIAFMIIFVFLLYKSVYNWLFSLNKNQNRLFSFVNVFVVLLVFFSSFVKVLSMYEFVLIILLYVFTLLFNRYRILPSGKEYFNYLSVDLRTLHLKTARIKFFSSLFIIFVFIILLYLFTTFV